MQVRRGLLTRLDETGIPLLIARLAVGGMFAYLALLKLSNPFEFLKQVNQYQIVPADPPQLMNFLSLMLPYLELICAAALIFGFLLRGAGATILAMLLFFCPLLVYRAMQEYASGAFPGFCWVKFDCGCGTGEVFICRKLLENAALIVGSLITVLSRSRFLCLEALLRRRPRAANGLEPALSGA